jgi:hypothetical protein
MIKSNYEIPPSFSVHKVVPVASLNTCTGLQVNVELD